MRIGRVESGFQPGVEARAAESQRGMVATAFADATDAGVAMLEQGGNAADAACAAGLALGVCEPQASGIGGQSLALCHFDGRSTFLDGSSRAPSLVHHERLTKADRRVGYSATTVPTTLATYGWLHEHHGRLPWDVVLEPAVRLAREGYRITRLQNYLQERELARFERVPSRSGAKYFLDAAGRPYEADDIFVQPDLAALLEEIGRNGVEAFYQGDIAAQIDSDMRANDGLLRAEDLALIPWPIERRPLRRRYRSVTVETAPPPAAGRILLLVMMMLGTVRSSALTTETPEHYHLLCETFRKAFLRRVDRPFDPNGFEQIRDKKLLSREFATALALSIVDGIDPGLPLDDAIDEDLDAIGEPGRGETTHLSVMDAEGNAVSVTQSIELVYGSKAAAEGLGFLYNNYLLAYETEDPSHPYFLRPNAVPWSTAAPVIVHRDRRPWIVLGSPGSERIFSSIAQVLSNVVDHSMPIDQAVAAPRLHCSIGGKVSIEADRFDPGVTAYLEGAGYDVRRLDPHAFYLGCVQATLRCQTRPGFQGVADLRRDGTAAGP
jgi:gamma-glutamyltranspeptidase/glutathione hydrolase